MRRALPCFVLAVALSACAQFPDLDSRTTRGAQDAPYPALLPIDGLIAEAEAPGLALRAGASLEARAAALRARASALRRPVIDAGTRARLLAAIERRSN